MGVLLALVSVELRVSDFLGGVLSRRVPFVRVALLGQVGGLLVTVLAAPWAATGPLRALDLAWGALSGRGTGSAMTFLFRGMSCGSMSVVVPVNAVGRIALPVVIGTVLLGERPAVLVWVGIMLALSALWLVSGGALRARQLAGGALAVGLAGAGIALQYLALEQAAPGSGVWPVAAGRFSAVIAVAALSAALLSNPALTPYARPRRLGLPAMAAGALAALALEAYSELSG